MSNSEQALKEGNLAQALADLQQLIRKDPANSKHRIYLFQLYAVLGQWEKALNQLNVLAEMDASTLAMVQTYREAIRCEVLRKEIFAGLKTPLIFGEPQEWLAYLQQALKLTATQQYQQAQELRNLAFELAPTLSGTIDGAAFDWLADADMRLGPLLEAIVNGQYYWIPFQWIQTIHFEEPTDLRDVVWMPAFFTWRNGGETVGLVPTRYSDSENQPDPLLQLARKTEWLEPSAELFIGLGQRLFSTDADEYPVMDVREINFA